jgi:hypothetical protein
MAFPDDFITCMAQYGVQVDAGSLPDQGTLQQALEYLQNWFSSLDPSYQAGVDGATANEPSSVVFADPAVNLAPAIPGLLQAFDAAQGQPLSQLLQSAVYCLSQVSP